MILKASFTLIVMFIVQASLVMIAIYNHNMFKVQATVFLANIIIDKRSYFFIFILVVEQLQQRRHFL
jgi:hypothetical protein